MLFFLFSGCVHSAFFLFGLLVFVILKANVQKSYAILLAVLVSLAFNTMFLDIAAPLLGKRMEWYFSNRSVVSSYANMTIIGFMIFWAMKVTAIPFAILLFKSYDIKQQWNRYSMAWFVVSLACIGNAVLFYRSWWVFTAIGIYMLLEIENVHGILAKGIIRKLLLCGTLFIALNALNSRGMILHSNYQRLFKPVPFIFSEHYTKEWVFKNIDTHGVYRNKY